MRVIWKFVVPMSAFERPTEVMMPKSNIKHFAVQGRNFCIWAECDPQTKMYPRYFRIYATGDEIEDQYWGTVLTAGGDAVWHLYEIGTA